jgi:hypothetical protein
LSKEVPRNEGEDFDKGSLHKVEMTKGRSTFSTDLPPDIKNNRY